jgi:putative hydroxymethylpyrimidine transport system substrate-binding protein
VNEPLLKTMVETSGGDPANVNLIDVGFDLGAALVSGQVDAVIGAYINHEVPVLKHQGHDVHYFDPVEFGVPPYYELVIVTNDTTWAEQEEEIRAFWRAAQKGYQFMKENPEESLDILFAHQDQANFPLIREVEEESLSILLSKMETEDESFGSQSKEAWQEITQWLLEGGLIEKAPSVEEMFVNLGE